MDFRSLLIDALMPHSLAALEKHSKPPAPEDERQKRVQAAIDGAAGHWNTSSLRHLVALIAAMTDNPQWATLTPSNGGDRLVYDATTILVATKSHDGWSKNQLMFVYQGIDRAAWAEQGEAYNYRTDYTRLAVAIEIAAYYGGLTPDAVKKMLVSSYIAHIVEPLFNPKVEVVDEDKDAIIPPPDTELSAIVAEAMKDVPF